MRFVEKQETLKYKENLIDLIVQFIRFLDCLLDEGKITQKEYEDLTKNKIDFLKHCNFELGNVLKNCF